MARICSKVILTRLGAAAIMEFFQDILPNSFAEISSAK